MRRTKLRCGQKLFRRGKNNFLERKYWIREKALLNNYISEVASCVFRRWLGPVSRNSPNIFNRFSRMTGRRVGCLWTEIRWLRYSNAISSSLQVSQSLRINTATDLDFNSANCWDYPWQRHTQIRWVNLSQTSFFSTFNTLIPNQDTLNAWYSGNFQANIYFSRK